MEEQRAAEVIFKVHTLNLEKTPCIAGESWALLGLCSNIFVHELHPEQMQEGLVFDNIKE